VTAAGSREDVAWELSLQGDETMMGRVHAISEKSCSRLFCQTSHTTIGRGAAIFFATKKIKNYLVIRDSYSYFYNHLILLPFGSHPFCQFGGNSWIFFIVIVIVILFYFISCVIHGYS